MGTARRAPPGTPRRGPTETAYERAVGILRRDGVLTPADGALVAAGRASARLVDDAARDGTPWMREAAIRRHVETLRELRMTPGARRDDHADGTDPFITAFAEFMADEAEQRRPMTFPAIEQRSPAPNGTHPERHG